MAQAKTRSSSKARSSSQRTKSAAAKRSGTSSNGTSARASKPRSRATSSASRTRTASRASGNGTKSSSSSNGSRTDPQAKTAVIAAVGTAAGLVGGAVFGRKLAKRPKRVLGLPVPGTRGGVDELTKQVVRAGKQVGRLAEEVRTVRKKAEKVGDAVS